MYNEITMVALIMALAQLLKKTEKNGFISSRYIPLLNLTLGVLAGFYLAGASITGAITGMAIGLSACGVYDIGSNAFIGEKEPEDVEETEVE